jgi:hypothetical protein
MFCSILLCAATLVLWARSYVVADGLAHWSSSLVPIRRSDDSAPTLLWQSGGHQFNADRGRIEFVAWNNPLVIIGRNRATAIGLPEGAGWQYSRSTGAVSSTSAFGLIDETYWQPRPAAVPATGVPTQRRAGSRRIWFPTWTAAVAFAVLPGCVWARRLGRQRGGCAGRCPTCGYDLRATPDRCPECGTATTVRSQ